jgi:multiple sugar transport system substrate-binding protein
MLKEVKHLGTRTACSKGTEILRFDQDDNYVQELCYARSSPASLTRIAAQHILAGSEAFRSRSPAALLPQVASTKGCGMVARETRPSPSPSGLGYTLSRRGLLQGAAGAAALGLGLPAGRARAQIELGTASGELTLGSNYSDPVPAAGLAAAVEAFPNKNVQVVINTTDHNTFQENITTYLQNPDDVIPWFAGYRMQFFAAQGLLGPIDDVWAADLNSIMSEGFKLASTGQDGQLYFVPFNYYCWGIHYRKSLFEENEWTPPATMDELRTLATAMQEAGIVPFALGNDGRWPAMGTFDQLNFRLNGYQFHMDLMAGSESWTDERVRNVFTEWEALLPFHQENPNGRGWQEAGAALANKECGMMTIGNFVGQQFPEDDLSDLDFFPWPEMNPEFGTDTIEAPIDGFLLAANPKNPEAAKELLYHFGTAAAQQAYLAEDPSSVAAALDVDPSIYNSLQAKAREAVSAAPTVTQFLDRDTNPEFASNVAGPAFADFLADPGSIDVILEDMQAQAEAIFGG